MLYTYLEQLSFHKVNSMYKYWILGSCLMLMSSQAAAVGVGVKAGTNGYGIELSVGVTEHINVRLMGSRIDIEDENETIAVGDSGSEGDLDAELDFDYGANAVFVDWFVFGNSFHVTFGAFQNNGEADLDATLLDDVVIDGQPLLTTDLGPISGEVSLGDSVQPYVGIGWGRKNDGGLSFSFDIGVALLDPDVDLEASVQGTTYTQAELNDILRGMEEDAEDDLDEFELWPVVAFGINYGF